MKLEEIKKKHEKKIKRFEKWAKINPKQLDQELSTNPGKLFSTGLKKSEAEFLLEKTKARLKQVKAKVKMKWSKKTIDGKKLTIPQLDAKVDCDSEVMKAEQEYIEAKFVFSVCETAVHSMKEKGQQITNLAHNRRAEMQHRYVNEAKEERVKKKFKKNK